jgi:hypothetical protein
MSLISRVFEILPNYDLTKTRSSVERFIAYVPSHPRRTILQAIDPTNRYRRRGFRGLRNKRALSFLILCPPLRRAREVSLRLFCVLMVICQQQRWCFVTVDVGGIWCVFLLLFYLEYYLFDQIMLTTFWSIIFLSNNSHEPC